MNTSILARPSEPASPSCPASRKTHGDVAPAELRLDALLARARRETGLRRFFAEAEFMPPLQRLLDALQHEAGLNAFGRQVALARTLGSLKNRLWAQACFEAHPEIAEQRIEAPVVIVGPHRSGTTRLHRLIAADPGWAHLKTWEGMNPAPRTLPPTAADVAVRRDEAARALVLRHACYAQATAMHAMDADWPEEEMLLLNHSFCSFSALGLYDIPGYYRWFVGADKSASYRTMAHLLQLVAWCRGDAPGRRWVLKNPQHMLDLPALLAVFPDARLVFTHRDPQRTVGSVLSMMCHFSAPQTDRDCRDSVRDTWLDFCETSARRCIQARAGIPAAQQLDLQYDEMNRDWRGTMRRVYAFAGLPLTAAVEAAMAAGLAAAEHAAPHTGHHYRLADFGLSEEAIESRMGFVRKRYSIAPETRRPTAAAAVLAG